MLERFRSHMDASGLIPKGQRVLLGYSGGADSTCLLHLLKILEIDVVAAHLHHGQRPEADKEMELCQAFAAELDVPFVSGRADVPAMVRDLGIGIEEAGREARYNFFRQAAFKLQCHLIATAHTRTDHVETVLLNMARGSGMKGLGGIRATRENLIRPLLPFSREETKTYCETRGFWTHDDPANTDVSFSRARVRHRILPEMRAINPSADAAIARLAEIVDEEDRFLNGAAAAALEKAELPLNGPLRFLTSDVEVCFDFEVLVSLPPVLFKRGLRLATEFLGAILSWEQTVVVMESVTKGDKGSITAEGGQVVVEWDERSVHSRQLQPSVPFRHPLTVPGETASNEFGWQLQGFETDPDSVPQTRASLETRLDMAKIRGPLYFRTAEPGDMMQPFGFSGRRRVSDLLSEAKLTGAARSRLPLICDLVGPLWAPGVCLDERARIGTETSRVLVLLFGPLQPTQGHNEETWLNRRT